MTRPFAPSAAYVLSPPEELREQYLTDVDPGVYAAVVVRWSAEDGYYSRYDRKSYGMCRVVVTGTYRDLLVCHSEADMEPRHKPVGARRSPTNNDFYGPDDRIEADETFYLHSVACTWDSWVSYCRLIQQGWHDREQAALQASTDALRDRLTDFGLHPRDGVATVEVDAPALRVFLDSYERSAELQVRLAEVEQELADAKAQVAA